MNKYTRIPLFSFALALLLVSCKKDDKDPIKQLTTEELLTTGKWQLVASQGEVPVIGPVDLFPSMNSCQKDDLKEFKLNGDLIFDQGATKCSASSLQTKTGGWVLSADKKKVTIKEPGESDTVVDILELTTSTLKVQYMGISTLPTTNTYSHAQ